MPEQFPDTPDEKKRSRASVPSIPFAKTEPSRLSQMADIGREVVRPIVTAGSATLTGSRLIRELLKHPETLLDSQLDRAYVALNDDLKYPERHYGRVWMETQELDRRGNKEYFGDDEVTVVFLPWDADVASCYDYGFIPKWGRTLGISTPGAFVNKNPAVTKDIFVQAIDTAKEYIDRILKENPNQKINVFSYSAANGGGFYAANTLIPRENRGRTLCIATGSGLGREIFASPVLESIKRDVVARGVPDGETYNKTFIHEKYGLLLPQDNCESLADDTTIVIGKNDMYIPAAFGHEIADKARRANPNVKKVEYPFGHVGTMIYVSHLENLRHMKVIRRMAEIIDDEAVASFASFLDRRGIRLPPDETKLWASMAQIVLGGSVKMNKLAVVTQDEERRTIEKISDDFFKAIMSESYRPYAEYLSMLSSQARGKLQAFK